MIEVDGKKIFLDPAEILFIESRKHKLLIQTINCEYLTAGDMFTYEQKRSCTCGPDLRNYIAVR